MKRAGAGRRYNFDLESIYDSFLQSIEDNQGASGDVPYVVPGPAPGAAASCTDIAWSSAYPRISSAVAAHYGDSRAASRRWPSLARYTENLLGHAAAGGGHSVATCDEFLDWVQ